MLENHPENAAKETSTNDLLDKSRRTYRRFEDYVHFTDDDPLWMLAYKLLLRFIGIAVMIALSPFLIIGLTIAALAVF